MARSVVDGPRASASSANSATALFASVTSMSISVGGALASIERAAVSMPPARTLASVQPRWATARLTVSRVTSSATQAMKLTAPLLAGMVFAASLAILVAGIRSSGAGTTDIDGEAARRAGVVGFGGLAVAVARVAIDRRIAAHWAHVAADEQIARVGDHQAEIGCVGATEIARHRIGVVARRRLAPVRAIRRRRDVAFDDDDHVVGGNGAAIGRQRGRSDAVADELARELTDARRCQLVVARRLEEHMVAAGDFGLVEEAGEAVSLAGGEVGRA